MTRTTEKSSKSMSSTLAGCNRGITPEEQALCIRKLTKFQQLVASQTDGLMYAAAGTQAAASTISPYSWSPHLQSSVLAVLRQTTLHSALNAETLQQDASNERIQCMLASSLRTIMMLS